MSDVVGRAVVSVDGCVETMSFEVNPPAPNGPGSHHQCYDDQRGSWNEALQPAKRSNWNVFKDQKFKISLEKHKGSHQSKKVQEPVIAPSYKIRVFHL